MNPEQPQTIPALLLANGRHDTRLIFDNVVFSYGELYDLSTRVATGLSRAGVAEGDRVAIWLANCPEWLAILCACARVGAIVVPLNPKFRVKEIGDIITRSGAKAVVIDSTTTDAKSVLADCPTLGDLRLVIDLNDQVEPVARFPELLVVPYGEILNASGTAPDRSLPESGSLIFTTSGTTNLPKFALHVQQRLVQHGRNVAAAIDMTSASTMAVVVPFCGTYGMSSLFAGLSGGSNLVIPASWNASRIASLLKERRVTHSMATDDGVEQLLNLADASSFETVRCLGISGMNPRLEAIFDAAETKGLTLVNMYGSSELQALVSIQNPSASRAERICRGGRLVSADSSVRVVDPATGETLAHGERGELQLLAPQSFMCGYFRNSEATAAAMTSDGYFRTGDLGYSQEDGRFVYLARMGDSMRLGGFLVDPTEIETVLETHDGIAEAQVVSIETEQGTRPVAFIIPRNQTTISDRDLIAFVGLKLARYKVPIHYHIVNEFPKAGGPNGVKVQKAKLRALAEQLANAAA